LSCAKYVVNAVVFLLAKQVVALCCLFLFGVFLLSSRHIPLM